jgi:hypothetical protein
LNLQRLHLQERDLQMRLEQQRQLVIKRDQQLSNGLPFPNVKFLNFLYFLNSFLMAII